MPAIPHSANNVDQSIVFHLSINLSFSFQTNDDHAASAAGARRVQWGPYFTCDQCPTLRCRVTDNVCIGGVWSPKIPVRCRFIIQRGSIKNKHLHFGPFRCQTCKNLNRKCSNGDSMRILPRYLVRANRIKWYYTAKNCDDGFIYVDAENDCDPEKNGQNRRSV